MSPSNLLQRQFYRNCNQHPELSALIGVVHGLCVPLHVFPLMNSFQYFKRKNQIQANGFPVIVSTQQIESKLTVTNSVF